MEFEDLNRIIEQGLIKAVFQPIISLKDGKVLGYEALSRIQCESSIKNIEQLFNEAEKNKQLWELELLCRTKALESAREFMKPLHKKKLFLNVNPNIMHDEKFRKGFTKKLLENYNIASNEIVFEITERNVIEDMTGFKTTVGNYKSQEYKIAVDDAGSGYSGLNLISEVNPNYIKLDMFLTHKVHKNRLKYALIKGMVEFSKASNILLIAEGIETLEEMDALISLGVEYGQGYYIQRPDSLIKEIEPEVLQSIKRLNRRNVSVVRKIISNFKKWQSKKNKYLN